MKILSICIICLGLFLTTTLIGIRVITLNPVFRLLTTNNIAFNLSQTIWHTSALNNFPLTYNELSHMQDVAHLVSRTILVTLLIDVLAVFLWLKFKFKLATVIKVSLALIAGLLVISSFSWNWFFTEFHLIFFPQGNWAFPVDSTLITLYPDSFWQKSALMLIAFQFLIYAGLFFVAAFDVPGWFWRSIGERES